MMINETKLMKGFQKSKCIQAEFLIKTLIVLKSSV